MKAAVPDSFHCRISDPGGRFPYSACRLVPAAESQYLLLKKEEHENRYRRLFLMTTGLKLRSNFMKKNSEEIESVMSNAYRLYEQLSAMDVPDDMKKMSLSIARDVHEIKKDYIRIIQGIEQEISEEYDEKQMSFQDFENSGCPRPITSWKPGPSISVWFSSALTTSSPESTMS